MAKCRYQTTYRAKRQRHRPSYPEHAAENQHTLPQRCSHPTVHSRNRRNWRTQPHFFQRRLQPCRHTPTRRRRMARQQPLRRPHPTLATTLLRNRTNRQNPRPTATNPALRPHRRHFNRPQPLSIKRTGAHQARPLSGICSTRMHRTFCTSHRIHFQPLGTLILIDIANLRL